MKLNIASTLKALLLAGFVAGLSACASHEKTLPPKPLPEIHEQVKVEQLWNRSIGEGQGKTWLKLEPAVDGERLFVADAQGLLVALKGDSGKVLWRKALQTRVSGGVAAFDGKVLVGTLDGYLVALNQENGAELWRAPVTSEVLGVPATDGHVVVVQTIDDKLTGFSADDGHRLWQQDALQPVLTLRGGGSPLVVDGTVYAGFANGEARAYQLGNGSLLWEGRVAIPKGSSELERMVDVDGTPLLSGGAVYMVSYQGNVVALDPDSGRVIWAREASSFNRLAEGFGNLYVSDDQSVLSAVDQHSGNVIWSQKDLERRQLSAPVTWGSYVLVGDFEGYLHIVSQLDGQLLGRTRVGSAGIRAKPVVSGDTVYIFGNSGQLSALRIRG